MYNKHKKNKDILWVNPLNYSGGDFEYLVSLFLEIMGHFELFTNYFLHLSIKHLVVSNIVNKCNIKLIIYILLKVYRNDNKSLRFLSRLLDRHTGCPRFNVTATILITSVAREINVKTK